METWFDKLKQKWETRHEGRLGPNYSSVIREPEDPLFVFRFPDNVMLVLHCRNDVKMMGHLRDHASERRLRNDLDQTKILATHIDKRGKTVPLDVDAVEILGPEAT